MTLVIAERQRLRLFEINNFSLRNSTAFEIIEMLELGESVQKIDYEPLRSRIIVFTDSLVMVYLHQNGEIIPYSKNFRVDQGKNSPKMLKIQTKIHNCSKMFRIEDKIYQFGRSGQEKCRRLTTIPTLGDKPCNMRVCQFNPTPVHTVIIQLYDKFVNVVYFNFRQKKVIRMRRTIRKSIRNTPNVVSAEYFHKSDSLVFTRHYSSSLYKIKNFFMNPCGHSWEYKAVKDGKDRIHCSPHLTRLNEENFVVEFEDSGWKMQCYKASSLNLWNDLNLGPADLTQIDKKKEFYRLEMDSFLVCYDQELKTVQTTLQKVEDFFLSELGNFTNHFIRGNLILVEDGANYTLKLFKRVGERLEFVFTIDPNEMLRDVNISISWKKRVKEIKEFYSPANLDWMTIAYQFNDVIAVLLNFEGSKINASLEINDFEWFDHSFEFCPLDNVWMVAREVADQDLKKIEFYDRKTMFSDFAVTYRYLDYGELTGFKKPSKDKLVVQLKDSLLIFELNYSQRSFVMSRHIKIETDWKVGQIDSLSIPMWLEKKTPIGFKIFDVEDLCWRVLEVHPFKETERLLIRRVKMVDRRFMMVLVEPPYGEYQHKAILIDTTNLKFNRLEYDPSMDMARMPDFGEKLKGTVLMGSFFYDVDMSGFLLG
jgi:hypothetical protein